MTQSFSKNLLLLTFAIAFPLSFVWEMVQMFAYAPFGQSALQQWLFCGLAAIADALYVVALYWAGTRLTQDARWITNLTGKRVVWIAIAGVVSATLTERIALGLGLWSYSTAMIQVPILQVGIIPLLQFFVLPILIFWLVKQLSKQQNTFN